MSEPELERAVWETVMRRLRLCVLLLGVVLLALVAKMIVSGHTLAVEVTTAIIALIFLGALLLTRHGRRFGPH